MACQKIDIQILPGVDCTLPRFWLRRVVRRSLVVADVYHPCRVGLVIADEDTVQHLNRDYRGLDEVTDVLSFSFRYSGHYEGDRKPDWMSGGDFQFVIPEGEIETLGEVILCYNQVVRQANKQGHTMEKELALLVTHGVLHLVGHDHEKPSEARAMQSLEQRALEDMFGRRII
jgi:probable rRNA maturation factor